MNVALVVAVVGLVVAVVGTGVSAYFAWSADQRAKRAELRDRLRTEREEADAVLARQPEIRETGHERPTEGPRQGQLVHHYSVRNNGPAVITELHLWIEDGDEEYISSGDRLVNLGTGETMFASLGVLKENRHGQRLMVQWTDAEGEYGPLWTGIRPPLEL